MIVNREGNQIVIELDQPWEQEVSAWIIQTYGEDFIRKHILKLLYSKQRAKEFMDIRSQM